MKFSKNIIILFYIILCMVLVGCSVNQEVPINNSINEMMEYIDLSGSKITSLANYSEFNRASLDIEVTNQDIHTHIEKVLNENMREIDVVDRVEVQNGDIVEVDYIIRNNEEVISEVQGVIVNVGKGNFDRAFENSIIHATLGDSYIFNWIVPNSETVYVERVDLAGVTVDIEAIVKRIYYLEKPILDDEFVEDHLGYESLDIFYERVYEQLLVQEVREKEISYMDKLISESEFDLLEEKVIENAVAIYYSYGEMVNVKDSDESQVTYLGIPEDELYDHCYIESENELKYYLVIGAIAEAENLSVTEDEIEELCLEKGYDIFKLTDETKCFMEYSLLEMKVLDLVFSDTVINP